MPLPIRALLLAAGFGTRLRPLTLHTPKCLVPLSGKPLLGHWLDKLEAIGCESVLINTHYLASKVNSFLHNYQTGQLNIKIVHEPHLLGTAGTLLANKDFFTGSTGLLVHADNAMSNDLHFFLDAHSNRSLSSLLTMLTFHTSTPSSCGIVVTDNSGVVTSFYEKSKDPPGNTANGALYAFDNNFLDYLSSTCPTATDFSNDVIPRLVGRIQTCQTDGLYLDIGTPESLAKAQQLWN